MSEAAGGEKSGAVQRSVARTDGAAERREEIERGRITAKMADSNRGLPAHRRRHGGERGKYRPRPARGTLGAGWSRARKPSLRAIGVGSRGDGGGGGKGREAGMGTAVGMATGA